MSILCPAGCGKKFVSEFHTKRHLEVFHKDWLVTVDDIKRKGWATPYGFVDAREPITYAEACECLKVISEAVAKRYVGKITLEDLI